MDKKRACLLARVSTKKREQEGSIDNQIKQLSDIILAQDDLIFSPEEDVFSDQFTGTKITRKNTNGKGFDELMRLENIEIVDNKNNDTIELTIKTNRNKKPKYDIIVCKSTSRFSRASYKGESIIYLLKDLGIDIFYLDLNKRLSQMSDEEIKLYSLIDSKFSKTVSFNYRNNFLMKTNNRELINRNKIFGYDRVRDEDKKIHLVPKESEVEIFNLMKTLFEQGKGCETIANTLNANGLTNNYGAKFTKQKVHQILKSQYYCGLEKYYKYDDGYVQRFGLDRKYLSDLEYELLPCKYIEPIETIKEYEDRQQEFLNRTVALKGKVGVKQTFSPISKICVCGVCGKHYFSKGKNKTYKDETCFICSSKRQAKANREIDCMNKAFYENYFYDKMQIQTVVFKNDLEVMYDGSISSLENLKVHLVLLLDSEKDNSSLLDLKRRQSDLKLQMANLLKVDLKSDAAVMMLNEQVAVIDKELGVVEHQIHELEHLVVYISLEIDRINSLIEQLTLERQAIKSDYEVEEMLAMFERILVFPKEKAYRANSVIFVPVTKSNHQVFKLIEELLESDIYKLLDDKLIKIKEQNKTHKKTLYVKNPSQVQLQRYKELEESI